MKTKRVNNEIYRQFGNAWWDDDVGGFSTIRFFVNPIRFAYFDRILRRSQVLERGKSKILDVGCGGGVLAEEFARAGFQVHGVDPAPESLETARAHAVASGLQIAYSVGSGERLPFPDASFDHVACCDVLEHVDDVDAVIGEIARVLRPQGQFLYDTINRTIKSNLAIIKLMQEWPSTAFAPPNAHVWDRFIKPAELAALLAEHGFEQKELRGISASSSPLATWWNFRLRGNGRISFKELGRRLAFQENDDLSVSYMGHAVKRG
jgi:2-polyprenyl-6-hydroxyphenyl methylase/3-demethylubiquinone-9 3-methyltransferase